MKTFILTVLVALAAVASVTETSAVETATVTTDCIVRPVDGIVGGFVRTLEGLLGTVPGSIGGALKTVTTTTIRLTGSLTTLRDRFGDSADHDDPNGDTDDGSGDGVKILVGIVNQLIGILSKLGSVRGHSCSDVLQSFPIDEIFSMFVHIFDGLSGVISDHVVNGLLEDIGKLRVQLSGLRNVSTEIRGRITFQERANINRAISAIAASVGKLVDGISNYTATAFLASGATNAVLHIASEAFAALMFSINVIHEVVETVVCLSVGASPQSIDISFKAVEQLTPILEYALNVGTILCVESAGIIELAVAMPGQVTHQLGPISKWIMDAFVILSGNITSQLASVTGR